MKSIQFSAALLALASAAALSGTAKAVTTFTTGDVLLGVYDTTGTSTVSYEVDLGSISTFAGITSPKVFTLTSDLATVFGTSFPAGLTYSVQALIPNTDTTAAYAPSTYFLTEAETTAGVHDTPIPSNGAGGTVNVNLKNLTTAGISGGGFRGQPLLAGSVFDATTVSNSLADSYNKEVNQGGGSFGLSNTVPAGNNGVRNTLGTSLSDFDQVDPIAGGDGLSSILGDFNFSSAGVLTFTPFLAVNVPEPTTYALLLGGVAFLAWVIKRRNARA